MSKQFLDYQGLQQYTKYLKSYFQSINAIDPKNIVEIKYKDLVALKNNKKLLPGQIYRLVDYTTTTNGKAINDQGKNADGLSQSAKHPFDLILMAIGIDTLSNEALAAQRTGDTYFSADALSKWEILYDINNDTAKYGWALSSGTGVIYYLKDDKENSLPYDFKNIQFKRENHWYYTFDNNGNDASLSTKVYNNKMDTSWVSTTELRGLNNNIFKGSAIYCNTLKTDCYNNIFGNLFTFNTLGQKVKNNTFGTNCFYNTIFNWFSNNIIGDNVRDNIFKDWFEGNIIGDYCAYNEFEIGTKYIQTMAGTNSEKFYGNKIKAIGSSLTNRLKLDAPILCRPYENGDTIKVYMDTEATPSPKNALIQNRKVFIMWITFNGFKGLYKDAPYSPDWQQWTIMPEAVGGECHCQAMTEEEILRACIEGGLVNE